MPVLLLPLFLFLVAPALHAAQVAHPQSPPPAVAPVLRERLIYGLLREPYDVTISPNGRLVAVAESADNGRSGAIRLYAANAQGILRSRWYGVRRPVGPGKYKTLPSIMAVAFSPDGRTLAAAALSGEVLLLPVGAVASRMPTPRLLPSPKVRPAAYSLAFTADSRKLAVGYGDGVVRLWQLPSGRSGAKALRAVASHRGRVLTVRIAGDWVFSGGEDRYVRWSPLAGKGTPGKYRYPGAVTAVSAGTGGVFAAGAGKGAPLLHWTWSGGGTPVGPVRMSRGASSESILSIAQARSGDARALLVGCESGRLEVLRLKDGKPEPPVRLSALPTRKVRAIAAAPGGAWFVTVHRGKTLRLWPGDLMHSGDTALHTLVPLLSSPLARSDSRGRGKEPVRMRRENR